MIRGVTVAAPLSTRLLTGFSSADAADAPAGQMTWAVHTTVLPSWFDPRR